ncbi:hypothetical protein Slin14017_G116670 [Septoria linicola]|nr:hypothetical protein Slin14017_G116670 [Septoria linicola]
MLNKEETLLKAIVESLVQAGFKGDVLNLEISTEFLTSLSLADKRLHYV